MAVAAVLPQSTSSAATNLPMAGGGATPHHRRLVFGRAAELRFPSYHSDAERGAELWRRWVAAAPAVP